MRNLATTVRLTASGPVRNRLPASRAFAPPAQRPSVPVAAGGHSFAGLPIQRQAELNRGVSPALPSPLKALAAQLPGVQNFYLIPDKPYEPLAPGDEAYGGNLARPETVTARIEGSRRLDVRGIGKSTAITAVIGNVGDQEMAIRRGERKALFRGGHLVGDQMLPDSINSFVDWNLAPQHHEFNSPVYSNTFEALVTKGVRPEGLLGGTKKAIPINVSITLSYDSTSYNVTAAELIARGIVTATELQRHGHLPGKVLTVPTRVPATWKAEAAIDLAGLKKAEAEKGWHFESVPLTEKIDSFREDALDRGKLPADAFSWSGGTDIGKDQFDQTTYGGGKTLSFDATQGSVDASNKLGSVTRTATAASKALVQLFPEPLDINVVEPGDLGSLLKRHTAFPKSFISSFTTAVTRFRPTGGWRNTREAFQAISGPGKGKLAAKKGSVGYRRLLTALSPANSEFARPMAAKKLYKPIRFAIASEPRGGVPHKRLVKIVRANDTDLSNVSSTSILLAVRKMEREKLVRVARGRISLRKKKKSRRKRGLHRDSKRRRKVKRRSTDAMEH